MTELNWTDFDLGAALKHYEAEVFLLHPLGHGLMDISCDARSPGTEWTPSCLVQRSLLISCLYHQMPARLLEVAWHTGKKAWLEEAPRQESADPKVWGISGCSSLSPRASRFFPLWANCWEARSKDRISGWKATGECVSQEQCKADCGSKLSGATCK